MTRINLTVFATLVANILTPSSLDSAARRTVTIKEGERLVVLVLRDTRATQLRGFHVESMKYAVSDKFYFFEA
jgi:hypothetical protein